MSVCKNFVFIHVCNNFFGMGGVYVFNFLCMCACKNVGVCMCAIILCACVVCMCVNDFRACMCEKICVHACVQ